MLNTPLFHGTALRFRGNGSLAVSTPSGSPRGVCVRSLGIGNISCSEGCLARNSLLGNNALEFSVNDRPGVGENARPRSCPCSFSGRLGGWEVMVV